MYYVGYYVGIPDLRWTILRDIFYEETSVAGHSMLSLFGLLILGVNEQIVMHEAAWGL